jgi:hypothetical protein
MAARLERAVQRTGNDAGAAAAIGRAFRAAIDARAPTIDEPEHFAFLHPARNALILLEDVYGVPVHVAAAGVLLDGEHPALMLPPAAWAQAAGAAAAGLLSDVPLSGAIADDAELLEALLACDRPVRLLALADRLDFIRHLHLDTGADRHAAHARTGSVFLPIAQRTDPLFVRRFEWWLGTFARRFL